MKKIIHKEFGHEYYLVEEYKGKMIVVPEDNPESDCHMVYDESCGSLFVVGLDDTKRHGYRESRPTTVQDARNYIDWETEAEKKRNVKLPKRGR